ncbi:MAG: C2H2-type zinc finger protein [Nitrososphaeraceae archaeon]
MGGYFSFNPPNEKIEGYGVYSCPYCDGRFATSDLYLRHVVKSHKDWTAYPGPPDLEKYRQLLEGKNNKSKVADMAEAND